MTKVNFLLTLSVHSLEKIWWELTKWSADVKSFDLQTNSLNQFFKEMYVDQSGEFVFGYWGLRKGYFILGISGKDLCSQGP